MAIERDRRFVEKLEQMRQSAERLEARGYPRQVLELALLEGLVDRTSLTDRALLDRLAERLEAAGFRDVAQGFDEEHGLGTITLVSRRDGVDRTVAVDLDLAASAEFRAMALNGEGLKALRAPGFTLTQGQDSTDIETIDEMLDTLYAGAKKGISIQRYKGLGEMNPDQLWKTTMDPERRRLLQVQVEDAVAADEIFTVLMGDQVEPRRVFIQENALSVKNLDV